MKKVIDFQIISSLYIKKTSFFTYMHLGRANQQITPARLCPPPPAHNAQSVRVREYALPHAPLYTQKGQDKKNSEHTKSEIKNITVFYYPAGRGKGWFLSAFIHKKKTVGGVKLTRTVDAMLWLNAKRYDATHANQGAKCEGEYATDEQ